MVEMDIEDIKRNVKEALNDALEDLFIAYDSLNGFKFPEYFLTANIALKFIGYSRTIDDSIITHIEEKTSEFATHCCPIMGVQDSSDNSIFHEVILAKKKDTIRKGKFDVCLYKKNDEDKQSFCCIEVKGNKPSNENLRKDLGRMTELFSIKDKTGKNNFEYAILPFVHDISLKWYSEKRIENIKKEKISMASSLSNEFVNWEFTVLDVKIVDTSTVVIEEDYLDCHGKYLVCCFIGTKKKEPQKC